ncbi:MAG TPA: hypothetical protein PKH07_15825, partial [bacterium]|nr:hypothetical protein [bacterium]
MKPKNAEQTSACPNRKTLLSWSLIRFLFVLAFWLTMISILWIREIQFEFFRNRAGTGNMASPVFSELLRYQYERETVGITALLILPVVEETKLGGEKSIPKGASWEIRQCGTLEIPLLGTRTPVALAGRMLLDSEFHLLRFDYSLEMPNGLFKTLGAISDQGTLDVQYGFSGNVQTMSFPVPKNGMSMYLAATPLLVHRIPFKPGTKHRIEQFNPFTAAMEEVRISFGQE